MIYFPRCENTLDISFNLKKCFYAGSICIYIRCGWIFNKTFFQSESKRCVLTVKGKPKQDNGHFHVSAPMP